MFDNPFRKSSYRMSSSDYWREHNRKSSYDGIKTVIDEGMSRMNYNLREDEFNIWFEYSKKMLEITTKENPDILLNYLRLGLTFFSSNVTPAQKLNACLQYLIEILKVL